MNDLLKRAEERFAAGDPLAAKYLLLSLVEVEPENAEAHNNLAVLFFQEKKTERALVHIRRALAKKPDYRDALLNFVDIAGATGDTRSLVSALDSFLRAQPGDTEIRSLRERLQPAQARAKPKLALICIKGLESFLKHVEAVLSEHFQLRTCYSAAVGDMLKAVEWADAVWIEWANEAAVELTRHPTALNGKQVICRLHSYEAFGPYLGQIAWEKIHDLVFVGDSLRDIALGINPAIQRRVRRIHVIPSGIDLDRLPFRARKPGPHLAYLGSINYKKGPMLLFHAFAELARIHPEVRLSIGGDIQDYRYSLYFRQLADELGLSARIRFDGRIEDVPGWLADKDYIICSSLLESQYLAIQEAMACGIKPLVHNFVGARRIYPDHLIWNTIGDFVRLYEEPDYDSVSYRRFIEERYALTTHTAALKRLVEPLL